MTTEPTDGPNILKILWEAIWNMLTGLLGMFGISPENVVWALGIAGVLFFVLASIQSARYQRFEPGVIRFVTGALGSGKSAYSARLIGKSLKAGRPVATNVKLVDDWPRRVSGRFLTLRLQPKKRREYERRIRRFYHYEEDIAQLINVRASCNVCRKDPRECEHRPREGRALLVIDEVDNEINNRNFMAENQREFLKKLRMARKRGFVVYFISQHAENVDKGARRIMLENERLVNWQQLVRIPFVGAPLLPFPIFSVSRYRNSESLHASVAQKDKRMGRQIFKINWTSNLYDTYQDYGEDDESLAQNAVLLPIPEGEHPTGGSPSGAVTGQLRANEGS